MAEAVKQVEATINGAIEAIAELDWYVPPVYERISADYSRQYHLVKPIMTDRPVLEISEGRHLIQEQLVHTYVTNDTLLQGGHQEDESGLNSMVSAPPLKRPELIEDDRDWCEWVWEICIWQASCSYCVHGSDREFRPCYQRYYWHRR
jgi:hypothetical protein